MDSQNLTTNAYLSTPAFILAAAGAAVGVGSIWRFPYVMGENGGGMFFFLFIGCLLVTGIPVMISEVCIGRSGRSDPTTSLELLAQEAGYSKQWGKVAWLGATTALILLSIYSMVSGWILYYLQLSFRGSVETSSIVDGYQQMQFFLESPITVIFYHTIFILLVFLVSSYKNFRGVEQLNKYTIPLLFLILLLMLAWSTHLPGFTNALEYLFIPRLELFQWDILLKALGESFFVLGVGACCMMAYASHMPTKQSVLKMTMLVAIIDILVASIAGVIIFSLIFTEGMEPASGPELMFVVLPITLNAVPYGELFLFIFMLILLITAWTSAVNLLEPMLKGLCGRFSISRISACIYALGVTWLLGLIPILSLYGEKIGSSLGGTIFDFYTKISVYWLLPLSGLLILFFAGHIMNTYTFQQQVSSVPIVQAVTVCLIRYISPVLVVIILVYSIFS